MLGLGFPDPVQRRTAKNWVVSQFEIHMVALHFHYYNFGRVHKTLRVTPAMETGLADHVWSLEEIASLAQ
jgi:hypothetical protein